ncbi:hypothetical protein YC2023_048823 [Brassica napus]
MGSFFFCGTFPTTAITRHELLSSKLFDARIGFLRTFTRNVALQKRIINYMGYIIVSVFYLGYLFIHYYPGNLGGRNSISKVPLMIKNDGTKCNITGKSRGNFIKEFLN